LIAGSGDGEIYQFVYPVRFQFRDAHQQQGDRPTNIRIAMIERIEQTSDDRFGRLRQMREDVSDRPFLTGLCLK
jgi:hypothetical protein